MKTALLPSLLLASSMFVGCQKDVHEVRRTDPEKYSVDSGALSVDSGRYEPATGMYGPATGRYSAGTSKVGAPATPSGAPVGIGSPGKTTRD
jgi:hypothetical protein